MLESLHATVSLGWTILERKCCLGQLETAHPRMFIPRGGCHNFAQWFRDVAVIMQLLFSCIHTVLSVRP